MKKVLLPLPDELHNALTQYAKDRMMSVSDVMRQACLDFAFGEGYLVRPETPREVAERERDLEAKASLAAKRTEAVVAVKKQARVVQLSPEEQALRDHHEQCRLAEDRKREAEAARKPQARVNPPVTRPVVRFEDDDDLDRIFSSIDD